MATNSHLITHDLRATSLAGEEGIVSAESLRSSVCVCHFVNPRRNRELLIQNRCHLLSVVANHRF